MKPTTKPAKPTAAVRVVYRGPSRYGAERIVAFVAPHAASKIGAGVLGLTIAPESLWTQHSHNWFGVIREGSDKFVCGPCPRRSRAAGGNGSCYTHTSGNGFGISRLSRLVREATDQELRDLGGRFQVLRSAVWGDAAALPVRAWERLHDLLGLPVLGYTHDWRSASTEHLQATHMASCDTVADAHFAQALGWRTFLVTQPGVRPQDLPGLKTGWCPASYEWTGGMGKPAVPCSVCRLCTGGQRASARNVLIWNHSTPHKNEYQGALAGQGLLFV